MKVSFLFSDALTKRGLDQYYFEIEGKNAYHSLTYASILDTHSRVYLVLRRFYCVIFLVWFN